MRMGHFFVGVLEWLPIVATPFVLAALTDNFSHGLDTETWLIVGFVLALNVGWLMLMRWARSTSEFLGKYPGFRVKR